MNTRQVLLAAVVVAVVGSMMALPWFICLHWQGANAKAERNDGPADAFRYDGKTLEQWRAAWAKELKPEQRLEALRAMTAFGTHGQGKEAAEIVVEMLRERCKDLRPDPAPGEQDAILKEAQNALMRIGPPSSLVLLECLKDPAKNVGPFARIFMEVELHPTAIPVLVKLVQGDNPEWSTLALQALGNTLQKKAVPVEIETALLDAVKKGKHAKKFLDVLERSFAEPKTCRATVLIMRTLGPTAQPIVAPLLEAVQKKLPPPLVGAAGPAALAVQLPTAEDAQGKSDLCLMLEALGKIHGEPNRVLPLLAGFANCWSERRQEVRCSAVKALAEFGSQAYSAIPVLVEALDDSLGCDALEALVKIEANPIHVVPRLVQTLARQIDEPVRVGKPVSAIPYDSDFDQQLPVRAQANLKFVKCSLDYLGRVGPQAGEAVPVLVRLFYKVNDVRPQVVTVLEKIGPVARLEAQRLGDELRAVEAKNLPVPAMPTTQTTSAVKPVNHTDWAPNQEAPNRPQPSPPAKAPSDAKLVESQAIRVTTPSRQAPQPPGPQYNLRPLQPFQPMVTPQPPATQYDPKPLPQFQPPPSPSYQSPAPAPFVPRYNALPMPPPDLGGGSIDVLPPAMPLPPPLLGK